MADFKVKKLEPDLDFDIKLIAVAWAEGIQAAIQAFKEITCRTSSTRNVSTTSSEKKIASAASLQFNQKMRSDSTTQDSDE